MSEDQNVTQSPARAQEIAQASARAQELVMQHTHREVDRHLLTHLTQEVQEMIVSLEKTKGATTFPETAETGMLRVSMIKLIGDLQFYKVLPANLHVSNGTVVRHL